MEKKKLKITQVKSSIGYRQRTKDTLAALGIKRLNGNVIKDSSPAIEGMIKAVGHLVRVEEL